MQNASRPSVCELMYSCFYPRGASTAQDRLTSNPNNLTFNTQLILITSSDPADVSTLTNPDIRSILDPIPHESRRERQDQDKAENTPDDLTLNKGKEEVPCRV